VKKWTLINKATKNSFELCQFIQIRRSSVHQELVLDLFTSQYGWVPSRCQDIRIWCTVKLALFKKSNYLFPKAVIINHKSYLETLFQFIIMWIIKVVECVFARKNFCPAGQKPTPLSIHWSQELRMETLKGYKLETMCVFFLSCEVSPL